MVETLQRFLGGLRCAGVGFGRRKISIELMTHTDIRHLSREHPSLPEVIARRDRVAENVMCTAAVQQRAGVIAGIAIFG
jgi:hypothetical protein